jgi:hypothetical protein
VADEPTQPAGVPVVIALTYTPEGEQDHARIGRLEHHPRSTARRMVDSGQARWLDDPRNVDDRWPIEDQPAVGRDEPEVGDANVAAEPKPLTAMSKSELRATGPAAAGMPADATRLELIAAARKEAERGARPNGAAGGGGPATTDEAAAVAEPSGE